MNESTEQLLDQIEQRLQSLESFRQARIEAMAVSRVSKLPYKALIYREALLWRITELGRSSFESFKSGRLASAILLARAVIETSSALWYLWTKLDAATKAAAVGELDELLMRLVMGSKIDRDILPEAVNVLNFLDQIDKQVKGFRLQYERLCEFAHPNWAGTTLFYSKDDREKRATDFGAYIRGGDNAKKLGALNLDTSLRMFEVAYVLIGDLMPALVAICERSRAKGES